MQPELIEANANVETVAVDGPGEQRGVRQGAQTDSEGQLYTRPGHVPYLDVAATLSADRGALHLSVINRHRSRAITAQLVVDGRAANVPPRAEVSAIGHDVTDVLAVNTMPRPDQVALRDLGSIQIQEGHHSFPAHSVSLLTLHLRRD
jgi:alpha-N-arabinofuranosidase